MYVFQVSLIYVGNRGGLIFPTKDQKFDKTFSSCQSIKFINTQVTTYIGSQVLDSLLEKKIIQSLDFQRLDQFFEKIQIFYFIRVINVCEYVEFIF